MIYNKIMAVEDSNTKLLIHFDGTAGQTTYTAETGQTVTFGGSAVIGTAQAKFGTSSLQLNGGASTWVTLEDSADWAMGTGAWTADWWTRWTSGATHNASWFGQYVNGNNRWGAGMQPNFMYASYIVDASTAKANYNKAWAPTDGVWYHIAVVRNGDDCLWFLDGVEQNPTVTTAYPAGYSNADLATVFTIGGGGGDGQLNGFIDEFRFSKGTARWTGNFTPGTAPYVTATNFTRGLSASVGLTDSIGRTASFFKTVSQNTIGLSDSLSRISSYARKHADTIGITDTVNKASGTFIFISQDSVGITDLISTVKVLIINIDQDTVGLTDSLIRLAAFSKKITDTVNLTDVISRQIMYSRDVTDSVGLTDTLVSLQMTHYLRSLTDNVGLTDSATFTTTTSDVYDPIIEFYQVESIIPTLEGIDENIPPMYDVIDG